MLCSHMMQISRLLNKPHVITTSLFTSKLEVTIVTLHMITHGILLLSSEGTSLMLANKLLLSILNVFNTHFTFEIGTQKIQFFAETQPKC
jgi:hypothetical protein